MHRYVALIAFISTALCAQDVMNQGVAAFRSGNYRQALEFFQQEVSAHPTSVNGHLYLGTAFMTLWAPGAGSPENEAVARSAEIEFKRVLELDANNKTAIGSLASISYNSAPALKGDEKIRKLDDAMDWYKRLAAVDPTDKTAPYSMGVIVWAKWYPALMTARAAQHLKPEDPGPLASPQREELRAQYSSMLEEGVADLERALQLDPQYSDAMAYMNLLIRERADLRDTKTEWAADVTVADQWVNKSLAVKKMQVQSGIAPSPPPPPPTGGGGGSRTFLGGGAPEAPQRIRVGGNVQAANIIQKVEPVYPPLAQQARVSGQVRFTVIIGKDGRILNVQLVSGHPLLVASALEAVKQWIYKPTLLNGNPVEVITQVDVNFTLN